MVDWREEAASSARSFFDDYIDWIVNQDLINGVADDLYTLGEENGVDIHDWCFEETDRSCNSLSLRDAVDILEQLEQWEETDNGLWEGQPPREAIVSMGFWTFHAALQGMLSQIVDRISTYPPLVDALRDRDEGDKSITPEILGMMVESAVESYTYQG